MILDSKGNAIKKAPVPHDDMRNGSMVDVHQLPRGAFISFQKSREFQNKLRNDPELRERIAKADKMTGTKSLHMAVLENGEMTEYQERALMNNQAVAERIRRQSTNNNQLLRV